MFKNKAQFLGDVITMNTYQIEKIEEFSTFNKDVYLDKKFILLPNGVPFDATLKAKLLETSFVSVYSEGVIEDLGIKKPVTEENTPSGSVPVVHEEEEELTEEEQKVKIAVENSYITFLAKISEIYSNFGSRQTLDVEKIFELAKEVYEYVKESKHKITSMSQDMFKHSEPEVVLHVMRTAVFAIIIAIQVKMPENRIIELAVASLLHKISFLRIPPQLYDNNRSIMGKDLKTFCSHPLVSFRILRDAGFPPSVCAGVLEHHEREDGSGYPRALKSEDISIFGKILSVACSFEASTGGFHGGYGVNSVLEVVRNNNKQYNDVILKSLLFSISVFPIGTFVQLSDKRIGQVVDINANDLSHPVVLIYGGMSSRGEAQFVNTSKEGITIRKPLNKAEIDEVKRSRSAPKL